MEGLVGTLGIDDLEGMAGTAGIDDLEGMAGTVGIDGTSETAGALGIVGIVVCAVTTLVSAVNKASERNKRPRFGFLNTVIKFSG